MGRRTAILIGNQRFLPESGLSHLAGPKNDVAAMASVLSDHSLGRFDVKTHVDDGNDVILSSLEATLDSAERQDTVLIFYAGHGKLDRKGRLCLAAANTSAQLRATSVTAAHLADLVEASRCECVIVILDCCYSGAFGSEATSRGDTDSQLSLMSKARGLHIFTASTSTQTSSELETCANGTVMGRFTQAIVEGIRTGAADLDHDHKISLTDLRLYVERAVKGQTPRYWVKNVSGDPVIALAAQAVVESSTPTSPSSPGSFEPLEPTSPKPAGGLWHPAFAGGSLVLVTAVLFVLVAYDAAKDKTATQDDLSGSAQTASPVPSAGSLPEAATTPPTITVDCKRFDSDKDGVNDCDDKCWSSLGQTVGFDGCEVDVKIDLAGVNFDQGSAALRPDAMTILDEATEILKRHSRLRVELAGHTDSLGSDEESQYLSELRARVVYNYLVGRGIDASRLIRTGYGERRPIAPNTDESGADNPDGQARNNRVDLNVQG